MKKVDLESNVLPIITLCALAGIPLSLSEEVEPIQHKRKQYSDNLNPRQTYQRPPHTLGIQQRGRSYGSTRPNPIQNYP